MIFGRMVTVLVGLAQGVLNRGGSPRLLTEEFLGSGVPGIRGLSGPLRLRVQSRSRTQLRIAIQGVSKGGFLRGGQISIIGVGARTGCNS